MSYICQHCEREAELAKTITLYNEDGIEEQLQLLCDTCYEDWLHSLKG